MEIYHSKATVTELSKNKKEIELNSLSEKDLTKFRRNNIGFGFQFYNLVSSLTAVENVKIAAKVTHSGQKAQKLTTLLLNEVGIKEENQKKFPEQLSGGGTTKRITTTSINKRT